VVVVVVPRASSKRMTTPGPRANRFQLEGAPANGGDEFAVEIAPTGAAAAGLDAEPFAAGSLGRGVAGATGEPDDEAVRAAVE